MALGAEEAAGQPKQVAVTGAGGFIGGHLCRGLAALGHTVVPLIRPGGRLGPSGFVSVAVDLADARAVRAALAGLDGVVHAAVGERSETLAGTEAVLSAARTEGLKVVHLSSVAVYGPADGTFDEASPLPSDLSGYGALKAEQERLCADYHGEEDPKGQKGDVVVLRPGIVTGSGSHFWVTDVLARSEAGGLGAIGRDGEGTLAPLHWQDLVHAVHRCLALERSEALPVFNVTGAEEITWNAYFAGLAEACGKPVRNRTTGSFRTRMALGLAAKALARVMPFDPLQNAAAAMPSLGALKVYRRRAHYPHDALTVATGWQPRLTAQQIFEEVADAGQQP